MSKSYVIIGANGQLGTALQQQYPQARAVDVAELDITDKEAVAAFDWRGVEVILNAAAYTDVDGAESTEGRLLAWSINADAVANLVAVAAQHDATLVHLSTEYVFDGTQSPHREDEPLSPLSVYGASKAAGDVAVSLTPKHYLLRTSWVIGEGKNFVNTMLTLADKGVEPAVVSDQVGRLTFTSELVRAIHHLLMEQADYGTYNITNGGDAVSWAEVTREIFQLVGYDGAVTDVTTDEYFADKPEAAQRPLESTLDLAKIEQTGFTPRDWRDDLKQYVQGKQANS